VVANNKKFNEDPAYRDKGGKFVKGHKNRLCISDEKKVIVKSLVDAGMPYRDIAAAVGDVSRAYITRIVDEFQSNKPMIDWYKKNKSDILLRMQFEDIGLQQAIKSTLSLEDMQQWTPSQKKEWFSALAIDFGIKYDKERLESGQSTENVGLVVKAIHEWKRLKENSGSSDQN
jgi:hypothetical protein